MGTAEVCRRHEFSSATFYKWNSKFGGQEMSGALRQRPRELAAERRQFGYRRPGLPVGAGGHHT